MALPQQVSLLLISSCWFPYVYWQCIDTRVFFLEVKNESFSS